MESIYYWLPIALFLGFMVGMVVLAIFLEYVDNPNGNCINKEDKTCYKITSHCEKEINEQKYIRCHQNKEAKE